MREGAGWQKQEIVLAIKKKPGAGVGTQEKNDIVKVT